MLSEREMAEIGRLVSSAVSREVANALQGAVLARAARVATQTVLGVAPIRNMTSPNGDTISEAAVWMGVDQELSANAMWCPIARGVTLTAAGGDYVHVSRDSPASGIWVVDRKL